MVSTGRNDLLPVRNFLQVETFLANCNAWTPPEGSGYTSVNCFEHKFGNDFLQDLKTVRKSDILVSDVFVFHFKFCAESCLGLVWIPFNLQIAHHGGELNNGWFMRPSSSVIEVVMNRFQGIWPDFYFRSLYRTENVVLYWRADVLKDETWQPGSFEAAENSGAQ